ncbi:MAG: hypothetical protein ACLP6Z_08785 [Steroidobacteraceae bacterium]
MSGKAGVWIDHRNAVIIALSNDEEHTTRIASNVEKHLERGGDRPMKGRYEPLQVPADDSRQRALAGELNSYYDAVIAALRSYDRLLILGPGEAKGELHKRLEKAKLGARVVAIQTEGEMTDPQIAAKVRAHFGASAPRFQQHD